MNHISLKSRISTFALLLAVTIAQAQQPAHYLYLNAGGGLHNLSYPLANGTEKGSFGYTLNAGYGYFFSPHWGIQTGIGLQYFQPVGTLNYTASSPATDTDGATYELRTSYNQWKEKQQVLFLDLPLGLQYRRSLGQKFEFLTAFGAKISLPTRASYKVTAGDIATTGYYAQWNVVLSDMPQHGFTTVTSRPTGDVFLKASYSLFVDLGGLYKLSERFDLYAGCYINYGLNNLLKAPDKVLYQPDGTYNGMLASNQTDKAKLVSCGLKIGVLWHFGRKKTATPPETLAPVEEKHLVDTAAPVRQETPIAVQTLVQQEAVVVTEAPIVAPAAPAKDTTEKVIAQPQPKDSVYAQAREIAASTDIKFGLNSDSLLTSNSEKIKALSDLLKENPEMVLHIVGHTCDISSREINLEVGMRRANVVKGEFLAQGVSEAQLVIESKAFDEPLVPNTSDENRAKNRRVELILK